MTVESSDGGMGNLSNVNIVLTCVVHRPNKKQQINNSARPDIKPNVGLKNIPFILTVLI